MRAEMVGRAQSITAYRRRRCPFGCGWDFESEVGYLSHLEQHHGLNEERWRAVDDRGTVQAQFTGRGQRGVVA